MTRQELDIHNTIQDLFAFTRFYYTGGGKVIDMIKEVLYEVYNRAEYDVEMKKDSDELSYLYSMRTILNKRILQLQPNDNTEVATASEEEEEKEINRILSQKYGPRNNHDEDSNEDNDEEELTQTISIKPSTSNRKRPRSNSPSNMNNNNDNDDNTATDNTASRELD
jgi:hypothetical protein